LNLLNPNHPNENDYCPAEPAVKLKKNFIIISGCSGSGKSTLMQELSGKGFKVIHEAGRQIVKEQNSIGGDALPWKDWMKFIELTVSRTMYMYNSMINVEEIVFFDRSIVDQISWGTDSKPVPPYLINAALNYRFNENVLISPPWEEIYSTDNERRHSYKDALASYESQIKAYEKFNYKFNIIPKLTVTERADFVTEFVKGVK